MAENPISAEIPRYRLVVLKHLPHLDKLDDVAVTYQELEAARDLDINRVLNEKAAGVMVPKEKTYVQTCFIPN